MKESIMPEFDAFVQAEVNIAITSVYRGYNAGVLSKNRCLERFYV